MSAFRVFLSVLGLVAIVAGASTAVLGADSILGVDSVSPSADSEMRFYAIWYAGAGWALLQAARRPEEGRVTIASVAVLFFLAGCSRALSWATEGRPHDVAVVLMVIELALPLVILPWLRVAAAGRGQK